MSTLLVLRERLRKLYAEHTIFIVKILQFVMGLLLFWMINSISVSWRRHPLYSVRLGWR